MSEEQVATEATTEEAAGQDQTQEEQMAANLQNMLKRFPDAPAQVQIDAWKAKHSEVFVSGFSDSEIYLWRAITRPEYIKIQKELQEPNAPVDQFRLEELVCETCVLWKSIKTSWAEGKAGTPNALSEQIMQNSNFLAPQQASMLVVRL
jgi:hypothetical protein